MKTIKNLISVFALMFLTLNLSAQSKVAHIDSQTLISEMPEVKEAQAQLEKLQKTYATEIDASMKEYQTKLQTYSADAQNQTQVTNDARQKELVANSLTMFSLNGTKNYGPANDPTNPELVVLLISPRNSDPTLLAESLLITYSPPSNSARTPPR